MADHGEGRRKKKKNTHKPVSLLGIDKRRKQRKGLKSTRSVSAKSMKG